MDNDTCCFLPPEQWFTSCPSAAPEYHLYDLSLGNENENDGNDIEDRFANAPCSGQTDFYLDFGNL